ncbi:MAG: cell division protein FtsX [Caldisericia bacterium]
MERKYMKNIHIFLREIKESFINILRSGFLTIISISVIIVSIYSIGMIFYFLNYSNVVKKEIENKIEISFYLYKGTNKVRIREIEEEIKSISGVESVKYISPDQALDDLIKEYPEYETIFKDLEKNPLPPTFFVKPKSVYSIDEIVSKISKISEVSDFFYSKDLVDKLLFSIKTFTYLSIFIVSIFVGIFIFFLGSNITVSIYNRRDDIEIMKFIGTQPSFIKRPFYIEGIILSLIGGIISSFLLNKSYIEITKLLNIILPFIENQNFYQNMNIYFYIYLNLTAIFISFFVSYFVLRRYLKEIYP